VLGITLAAFSIGFLILLNPVKTEFRAATWNGNQGNDSVVQHVLLFAQLTKDYYTTTGFHPMSEENAALLAERISTIGIFSVVVNMTPASVPYMNGTTYYSLLTKWIPRFLWPGKPEERTGNDFGQRYGFLDQSDLSTSLNFPWIVELYANFGAWGVLLGMGIFGAILAFLNRLFNQPQANPLEFVYGMALLFGLTMQESSFSLTVGNVFLLSVVFYVLLKQAYGGSIPPAKRMRRKPSGNNAG
jgi:O-antigen polysaccharide polymerase Wzy